MNPTINAMIQESLSEATARALLLTGQVREQSGIVAQWHDWAAAERSGVVTSWADAKVAA